MSLEQEIAALTQATNELTQTSLQSMNMAQTALQAAQQQFETYFITQPLTLEVGPARTITSIQSAWDFLSHKIILAPVLIKIDPGFYLESLRFSNQPYAHWITIQGAGKGQTIIQNAREEDVWIILCHNVRKLTLAGMTLRGHYTSSDPKSRDQITHGLGVSEHSQVYVHAGTLAIEYCWAALCVYKNSGVVAQELQISHSRYGVAIDGGFANVERARIIGLGRQAQEGVGITCVNGGVVVAYNALVTDFPWGYNAERNGTIDARDTVATDCETGFRSAFCGTVFAISARVERTHYGFAAEFNSTLYAVESTAMACDYGYLARWNSCLHANLSSVTHCITGYRAEVMGYLEAFQTNKNAKETPTLYSPSQYATLGNENAMICWS